MKKAKKKFTLKRWVERVLFYTFLALGMFDVMLVLCYMTTGYLNKPLIVISLILGLIIDCVLEKFARGN